MHTEALAKGKKCQVVDCDLKAFFDTVNHQKLMGKLRESIADPRVLKLILKYLKAGVILPDGSYGETREGVPQGGPLSPLLAEILLGELDHELEKRGHQFVRYADDFVILCHSPRAGECWPTSRQQSSAIRKPATASSINLSTRLIRLSANQKYAILFPPGSRCLDGEKA